MILLKMEVVAPMNRKLRKKSLKQLKTSGIIFSQNQLSSNTILEINSVKHLPIGLLLLQKILMENRSETFIGQ